MLRDHELSTVSKRWFSFLNFALLILFTVASTGVLTAMSLLASAVFRPLPYGHPERLVVVWETNASLQVGADDIPAAPATIMEWRSQQGLFTDVGAFVGAPVNLTGGGTPERLEGVRLTPDLFRLLQVSPLIGRTLVDTDANMAQPVAVISEGFWARRFSRGDVLGSRIRLNGRDHTIVGVMPDEFSFPIGIPLSPFMRAPRRVDIWLPIVWTPEQAADRGNHSYGVVARLHDGVGVSDVRAHLERIATERDRQLLPSQAGWRARVAFLTEELTATTRPICRSLPSERCCSSSARVPRAPTSCSLRCADASANCRFAPCLAPAPVTCCSRLQASHW